MAGTYSKVTSVFSGVKNFFKGVLASVKEPFSGIAEWFRGKFSKAWEKVRNVFSIGGKIFDGMKSGIEGTFKAVVNKLISGINTVISIPFKK